MLYLGEQFTAVPVRFQVRRLFTKAGPWEDIEPTDILLGGDPVQVTRYFPAENTIAASENHPTDDEVVSRRIGTFAEIGPPGAHGKPRRLRHATAAFEGNTAAVTGMTKGRFCGNEHLWTFVRATEPELLGVTEVDLSDPTFSHF